ncbi:hypothetical protein [Mesorhizobium sp. M0965]|uniref:hypothetical protein n=1 Tax=Mesorhizobium sp. M0965 TaxID=2957036 RepID=UPI003338E417
MNGFGSSCIPTVTLSITHKFGGQAQAQPYVSQARQSSPHDDVSGWRIAFLTSMAVSAISGAAAGEAVFIR